MKGILIFSLAAASLLVARSQAQQTPSPQPPMAAQPQNCGAAVLPRLLKGWRFPTKLQQAIDKERQQIENKTGVPIPTPAELVKQAQTATPCPAAKPAPAPPVPPTAPAPAPTATPTTSK